MPAAASHHREAGGGGRRSVTGAAALQRCPPPQQRPCPHHAQECRPDCQLGSLQRQVVQVQLAGGLPRPEDILLQCLGICLQSKCLLTGGQENQEHRHAGSLVGLELVMLHVTQEVQGMSPSQVLFARANDRGVRHDVRHDSRCPRPIPEAECVLPPPATCASANRHAECKRGRLEAMLVHLLQQVQHPRPLLAHLACNYGGIARDSVLLDE
mmetsp:Transcript_25590/g.70351  ORF Transcript_25590/g.70351 Transcript_25590/m.70351 type:complete len:212 (-) Transcript_25590:521-1156(-)